MARTVMLHQPDAECAVEQFLVFCGTQNLFHIGFLTAEKSEEYPVDFRHGHGGRNPVNFFEVGIGNVLDQVFKECFDGGVVQIKCFTVNLRPF